MAEGVYLGSIYGTLEMRTENWKKEIDRAKNDLQGLDKTTNSSLASIGKSFTSVGKTLSVGLTAPLVLFGKTSMDTAMNTQVAWKEVEKVYGSTAGAFERDVGMLGEAVDELTMKFGKQKVDVLNALAALAAMGYEGSEAVDMLTQALEFATTGQMELNTAMAGAIAISKIYGVSGDELKKVLASLNTVENSTAASMADLNEAVQTAGEAGRSAGVGIDELSAMMAVLRERAIPAGEAANGLKTIFTKLRTPVDDAKDIYDKYGFTVQETNGKLKEADEILLGLADLWPKLTDAEREELAQSNAGLYQKNKFLSLMADLSSENSTYRSTLDALGDSEQDVSNYTKEMNVFLDTNATKTAQAKAKFEELKVSIGDILSNMIVPLLQKLGDLAKKFGELSPETQKIIVIFGMIAAAIGPLLIIIGTLITSLTAIAGVVGIAVGPLLLIIAAIGLVVAAIVVFIMNLDNMKKKWVEIWNSIVEIWNSVWTAITDFWSGTILPILQSIGQFFIDLYNNWILPVINLIISIFNAFVSFFTWIWQNVLSPLLYLMAAIFARIFYEIFNVIKTVLEWIWNKMVTVWNAIWSFIEPFLIKMSDFFSSIWEMIKTATKAAWDFIKEHIINPISEAFGKVSEVLGNIYSGVESKFNSVLSFVSDVWQKIKDAIVKPFEEAKAKVEEIATKIREVADNINPFHRESPSLVDMVKKGIGEIKEQYQSLGSIQLSPISQSVSLVGASAISTPAKSFSGGNTITNSPQFSVNVGVYAGSEIEKRELAKELSDAYNAYRKSIGEGI